jgi:hypothetical protein
MEHSIRFESFGTVAEVATDDAALSRALAEVLPPGWVPATGEPFARFGLSAQGVVTLDGVVQDARGDVYSEPLMRLGSVVRHHLAVHAPAHVFIHAGVVAIDGGAVVIPGRSHSGKTSLVAALLELGARYYSDEYAVVDAAGLIHPYPKPLTVRIPGDQGLGRATAVPAGQLATEPIRAALIVATQYRPGERSQPVRASSAEGAQLLLANTPAARSRPRDSLSAVGHVARGALVLRGPRGEAQATAEAIFDTVRDGRTASRDGYESAP